MFQDLLAELFSPLFNPVIQLIDLSLSVFTQIAVSVVGFLLLYPYHYPKTLHWEHKSSLHGACAETHWLWGKGWAGIKKANWQSSHFKFYFNPFDILWICLGSVRILLLILFAPRTFSSFGTICLQLLFGMFLAALVLLLLIFLFLLFPNQTTKTRQQPLLPPKNQMYPVCI